MTDLINQLRQELATVTAERDDYKAHCETLKGDYLRAQNMASEFCQQRDAEREARKALQAALKTYNEIFFGDDQADAALALAAKLP